MKRILSTLFLILMATVLTAQTRRPLPLDPLTPEEEELARATALNDRRVRELVGDNPDPTPSIQFIAYKPPGRQDNTPAGRHADVVFALEPGRGAVRVLVDVPGKRVVDVVRVSEMSTGISQRDINAAITLAIRDARVIAALGGAETARSFHVAVEPDARRVTAGNIVEALRTIGDYPPDCNVHRCMVLLFRRGGHYLNDAGDVIVDLNTQQTYVTAREDRR